MISVDQALAIIHRHQIQTGTEDMPLKDCVNAVCAEDVVAKVTLPPFEASAMDGYAVRFEDAKLTGKTLTVIGDAPAGSPFDGQVEKGQAVRIFTGSPMPEGTDHVVIQENVTRTQNRILINAVSDTPKHIRKAGIDFKTGDCLIPQGTRLNPAHMALAAAGNHATLRVFRRPKIAVMASGDELRPPGSGLKPGQIINSNMAALSALITQWGGEPIDLGIAKDHPDHIAALLKDAKGADIILPTGGASVGDYDFMKEAFNLAGFDTLFSKIAVRPGKPTWFGARGHQRVLGLPGNPASAIVCAHLFLKPLMGAKMRSLITAKLSEPVAANGSRETYLRGHLCFQDGGLSVTPFPRQDSSLISPFITSNALLKLPPHSGPWAAGDNIQCLPLSTGPDIL